MSDPLREPGFLTEHQLRVVLHPGNFLLVACPGSGKTRTVGVRLARLAADGLRIASTSYTNIGVEQIRSVISGDLGITLGPEHFIGTLHGFLLRFVFYPFGHLVMECRVAPRLIADDTGWWRDVVYGNDHRIRAPLPRFRFRPDGSLCYQGRLPPGIQTAEEAAAAEQQQALRMKRAAARAGYASPDDSMYWALRVLEERPDLAALVAARFDELQVDEAQDTSELQLAALDRICNAGTLKSLVLVGDTEQSIFSFQGASPEGCLSLAEKYGLETVELTENHRSSQHICDVAVHFCGRATPDTAVGEHANCQLRPEVFLYDSQQPDAAVGHFRERLTVLGLSLNDAAVLGRGNDLVDELNLQNATVTCDPRPLALGRAAAMVQGAGTLTRRAIEAVDRAIVYTAWGETDLGAVEPERRAAARRVSVQVLRDVPSVSTGDLDGWIRAARDVIQDRIRELVVTPQHTPSQAFRSAQRYQGVLASSAFAPPAQALRAQTVHDIKGDSRDAVLVVADRPRARGRTPQSSTWSRLLVGGVLPPAELEELRIGYVALTRARRFCALALPSDTPQEAIEAFLRAGFVLVGT